MEPDRFVIRDAATMRALAHPARIASLERLMRGGPATATELGQVAGLTPSAMSYHLRSLEKAGLISTAPGRGDGRERVWQAEQSGGWSVDNFAESSADDPTVSVDLLRSVLGAQALRLSRWLSRSAEPGWLDAGFFTETVVVATDEEMESLGARINELIGELREARRADPPDAAVRRRVSFTSFPEVEVLPAEDVKD